jgi:hypothetical protein
MDSIFVKIEDKKSYYCTWDADSRKLIIQSGGLEIKSHPGIDFFEALKKIKKFKESLIEE